MSRISFSDGQVCRDGRSLHSPRDPAREASLWMAGRPARARGLVFVLGMGAGHHVREWARQRPDLTLVVLDFDAELFRATNVKMLTDLNAAIDVNAGLYGCLLHDSVPARDEALLERGYSAVRFRPAWAGREAEFTALEDVLLDRSILHIGEDLIAGAREQWPRGLDLNIKSLTAAGVNVVDNEDRKLLMALRELVA